ncbi:hypothetical protein FQ330_11685 [Agrococcus sediminis]|uniref:Uncharacterized protein n=1 Tax=Agrococcus sediminis TaxID=2599924 RepID=A0A5M8Q8A7_9MICO|nr:DUF5719 family protein [Agrococcus sediminis]KAA6430832.1 hypothetical protein FQ330_11685 [Agrococcus sediminis]
MTDRDETPDPLDESQQFDDPSPIRDDEEPPREHEPTEAELAVEAEAEPSGDIASDVALTDREAAANDAAESRRRFERRDAVRWSARGLAGLAAAALGVGAVLGATALPEDLRAQAQAPSTHVLPASPMQSRVCAGPVLRVGTADGQDALALAAIEEPSVTVGSLGGDVAQVPLTMRQAELPGAASIVQRGESSTLSAAQSVSVDVDAVRGLAASECAETRLEQWLVGGSTRTGRQTTLTIANGSEVAASVDVTVYGPDGPVETVGSTGVAVGAGQVEVLDLAAIAPGVADAVVHVASTGAPVTAHLQQTITRGLERGGFDVVDPVSALTGAVLPGVVVAEPSGLETQPDYDDTTPVLRLLSPTGGAVRVVFQSGDGSTIESEGSLEAGRVTDFPLDELPVGTLAVRIESDAPVVAGARSVAIAGEGLDFDWVAGGQPRSGASSIAVPAGPGARLHVVSTSDAEQEITIDGEAVRLPAMGVLERAVDGGAVEVVGDDLVIGVGYRSDSAIAGFTASPQGPAAEGVTVLH